MINPESIRGTWMARHDNDWQTLVIETSDGTFLASAGPRGQQLPKIDYVEIDAETANTAAMFALRQKSGHDTCSPACSDWEFHTHMAHEERFHTRRPASTEGKYNRLDATALGSHFLTR
jgi:hypothetical protein